MADSYFYTSTCSTAHQSPPSAASPFEGFDGGQGALIYPPASSAAPAFEGYEGAPNIRSETGPTNLPPPAPTAVNALDWPEPQLLQSGLLPVASLSPDHLPNALVPFVGDIADRMQCPADFVAASIITALGSLIGTRIAIRPKRYDDWLVRPNLWCMIVGRPGVMKSPAVSEAIRPLMKLEAAARDAFNQEAHTRAMQSDIYKARRRSFDEKLKKLLIDDPNARVHLEAPIEPPANYPRRFIVNDTTYEALGEIVSRSKDGILTYRDELMSLVQSLDREENINARGFYLTGYDGNQSYDFERITRGSIHIDRLCLSVLGTTQPGRLTSYVGKVNKGGGADDGMLQRFGLLLFPDQNSTWHYVDRASDISARNYIDSMFAGIANCNIENFKPEYDRDNQAYLTYTDEAAVDFVEWLTKLEHRLRSDELHPIFVSHLAKYRKLVPALSLIYHIADVGAGPINQYAIRRAIAYSNYLETHALRAYSAGINLSETTANLIATKLRKGSLSNEFTLRDVHQKAWSGLTDHEQVAAGLERLCEADWLRASIIPTGGRAKVMYEINPKICAC